MEADAKMERWSFGWKLLLPRGGRIRAGPLNRIEIAEMGRENILWIFIRVGTNKSVL